MLRRQNILQVLILLASIPFLYFIITDEEYNWLYHASLSMILVCSTISLIDQWRAGNTRLVRNTLIQYTVVILFCLALAIIFK